MARRADSVLTSHDLSSRDVSTHVAASFEVGEYWDKRCQIDVVGLRQDGWTDLGECRWGAVRSARPVRADLEANVVLYPTRRNATIGRRGFTRDPAPRERARPGDPELRWHDLAISTVDDAFGEAGPCQRERAHPDAPDVDRRETPAPDGHAPRAASEEMRRWTRSTRGRRRRRRTSGQVANQRRGSLARTRASGRPSSRRTILVPSTRATHL